MAEIRRIAAVHNADNARAATSLPDARVLDLQVLKNAGRCARRLGAFSSGFDPDCAKTGESGKVLNCRRSAPNNERPRWVGTGNPYHPLSAGEAAVVIGHPGNIFVSLRFKQRSWLGADQWAFFPTSTKN
ncbi:MAG: hypothetical protein EOQ42_08370 [Mesorhizobium sp.]|nr:MAG: hypothetical protein EOQ42_08370 [Mesorhizobium sp.]